MSEIQVKYGKPRTISYHTIKLLNGLIVTVDITILFYSLGVLFTAVKLKINIGYYINLVTDNDGDTLPLLLAILGLICLPISIFSIYLLYKLNSKKPRPTVNQLTFVLILISLGTFVVISAEYIMILVHVYSSHEALHNGISESMKNYSTDSLTKCEIDTLQIRFDCCGSQKYSEWFDIIWYDNNLISNNENLTKKSTPFSCCSKYSPYHCIHHGIDIEGTVYKYSPNKNFSISTVGCMEKIVEVKRSVAWDIIGHCFLMQALLTIGAILMRYVQTAHSNYLFFTREHDEYICWLIGKRVKNENTPPPIPPIPADLMD